MTLHCLGDTDCLEEGQMKTFQAGDQRVLLIRTQEGFFATQPKCPHLGMPLAKGKLLEDCVVRCKYHRAEFDIKSGEATRWANFPPGIQLLNVVREKKNLRTFATKVDDGKVYVEV